MERNSYTSTALETVCLDLRHAHTRVPRPRRVDMIASSIERFDQITPVLVIPEEDRLVLIDGFVRLAAIRKLGRDTIRADIREISEAQALFHLLADTEQRHWEAVEQAWIIRDVHERLGLSLREIARGIGRDASWVTRRLSLIEGLPEDILRAVAGGAVSTYAATRVLVPLARANKEHAEKLLAHLGEHPLSTRELGEFLRHYESCNKGTRERMVSDPTLFLKAKRSREDKTSAEALRRGPEGVWIRDWDMIKAALRRILQGFPTVIHPDQDADDRMRLLRPYREATGMMEDLARNIKGLDAQ